MGSGAAKTQLAFGGCHIWAATRSRVMRLCRTSEASVPAEEACQGGALGLIPTTCPRVCSWAGLLAGYGQQRGTHRACLSRAVCPGRWGPVVCTAHELGLEGIPATRQSTAIPKMTIPAPSSTWSKTLIICRAHTVRHSQVPLRPAQLCMKPGVSSRWLNHRIGIEMREDSASEPKC